jgi:hypothetical protein
MWFAFDLQVERAWREARAGGESREVLVLHLRGAMEAEERGKLAAQHEASQLRTAFAEAQHTVRCACAPGTMQGSGFYLA